MPLYRITRNGQLIGYRWGHTGHLYTVQAHGKQKAKARALRQGRAIHARRGH